MDRKLLDILACPATRQPLAMLDAKGLSALNAAIAGALEAFRKRQTDDVATNDDPRK